MRDVWLDVDTGVDDAHALLYALQSPTLRVLGVSCVAGNNGQSLVLDATKRVMDAACGMAAGPPLYSGAEAPLVEPSRHCPQIHGPAPPRPPQRLSRL